LAYPYAYLLEVGDESVRDESVRKREDESVRKEKMRV